MVNEGFNEWFNVVGLRYDEPRRVATARNQKNNKWETIAPMSEAKHTLEDVVAFWDKHNFDLNLKGYGGKTPAGNCDLCFLKGMNTTIKILRERPHMADWWIAKEKEVGANFRKDRPGYIELLEISKQPKAPELFDDDDQMTCFCHD